jgi:hypothetical protein
MSRLGNKRSSVLQTDRTNHVPNQPFGAREAVPSGPTRAVLTLIVAPQPSHVKQQFIDDYYLHFIASYGWRVSFRQR